MSGRSLGNDADALYKQKQKITKLEGELEELKSKLAKDADTFMKRMQKMEIASVKGRLCMISITKSEQFNVKDWNALYKYISRNKAFDLLHRRVSHPAYRDRIQAGKKVPGVETFTVYKPHITKRST